MTLKLILAAAVLAPSALLAGPKVTIFGDSYSTYEGVIPAGNYVWYEKPPKNKNDVVKAEQCWWSIVIKNLDGTLEKNESWSGAPICYKGWEKPEIVRKYAFVNRTERLGKPDLILICGGTNDAWCKAPMGEYKYADWKDADYNYYRPALAKTLADVQKLHPKAKVLFILNSGLAKNVNDSTHEICKHYKVPCVDLKGIDKGNTGHPTVAGMKAFAEQVTAAVKPLLK